MKTKFSCNLFKNIKFVECDKTSNFKSLVEAVKTIDTENLE